MLFEVRHFKDIARQGINLVVRQYLQLCLRLAYTKKPTVMYAGQVPDANAHSSGGAVKLAILAHKYKENGYAGNILYLVSSALPPAAATSWARIANQKGIKVVVNQNGVAFPAWANAISMEHFNGRNKNVLQCADHIIFQSKFCKTACEQFVGKFDKPFSIIYNPVDTRRFTFEKNAAREFDFLVIGSHSQSERVMLALEMIAMAQKAGIHWTLRVAGNLRWPNAVEEVNEFISKNLLNERVKITGSYSQAEAPSIFQSAKVLVHLQNKDASPTVPLEAMACGLSILGLYSGAMPELVPSELGSLLAVNDSWETYDYPSVESLFEAAQTRIKLAFELQANCRSHVVGGFSSEHFMQKHDQVFKQLVGGSDA